MKQVLTVGAVGVVLRDVTAATPGVLRGAGVGVMGLGLGGVHPLSSAPSGH